MSNYRNPRLITPPREEEEVYPYRRAWRSVFLESVIFILLSIILFTGFNLLGLSVPQALRVPTNIVIVIAPSILWMMISRVPERHVPEPRRRLLTVFTVSALTANAIGIPVIERIFQPEQWLPFQAMTARIMGYAFTVGVLNEFLKYLVLRYVVWPQYYRIRTDAIAYGAAAAIGYSLMWNLNYLITNPDVQIDALVIQVFMTTTLNLAGSLIVAYGLSETIFNRALSILLPLTLLAASIVIGIVIPLRTSFTIPALTLTVSLSRDLFGLAFTLVIYVLIITVIYFLFTVSEQNEDLKRSITE